MFASFDARSVPPDLRCKTANRGTLDCPCLRSCSGSSAITSFLSTSLIGALLNTHIEDFVCLAASRKIITRISTNLSLPLTDERIERIVASGLNEIVVSLDGASNATYGLYRRRGNFDLVFGNLRRLIEAKRRLGLKRPLVT